MSTRNIAILSATLFTLLSAVVLLSANTHSIKSILNTYHLLPEPEKFSELYFERHMELPQTSNQNEQIPFRFTLHNLENKVMEYKYQITAETTSSGKLLLDEGFIRLAHNDMKTIDANPMISSVSGRTKIEVSLPDQQQNIHFWTFVE